MIAPFALPFPSLSLAFLEGIGAGEMFLVAIIGLLLFGGKGLPDMARTFGKVIREFKKASASVEEEVKRVMNEEPASPTRKPAPRPAARIAPSATPLVAPPEPQALLPAPEPAPKPAGSPPPVALTSAPATGLHSNIQNAYRPIRRRPSSLLSCIQSFFSVPSSGPPNSWPR